MKKAVCLILAIGILAMLFGCGAVKAAAQANPAEEKAAVIYEAFFLDNDEIRGLFEQVRGTDAPYVNLTKDFHVTTAFMPEQDMHEYYGTEVTIHIYAYQDGEVIADDGSVTANEGFFCTVTTDHAALQDYINHLEKNWHITGSYQDQGGAKYTEYLDLTDAQEVAFAVVGRFGGYLSDGSISFSPAA